MNKEYVVALRDDPVYGEDGFRKGDKMVAIFNDDWFTDMCGDSRTISHHVGIGNVEKYNPDKPYSLKKFEKDIRKFNERCGNVDCTPEMTLAETCDAVLPQAKVILEEAKELLKACEEQNEQELLDGAVDCMVTSLRLLSLLGKRYDLMKAAELIMENNHLKYTDDLLLVQSWLAGTTYKMSGTVVKDVKYYCMKDDNGKIRKWAGFPKVELNVEELRK